MSSASDPIVLLSSDDDDHDPLYTNTRKKHKPSSSSSSSSSSFVELGMLLNRISHVSDSCVSVTLEQIIQPIGLERVYLFNYMVDTQFMISKCPVLNRVPVSIVQGMHGMQAGNNISVYTAKLPIAYGTHHSKIMILFYINGVRLWIGTANFIRVDWEAKTQGFWIKDFPLKQPNAKESKFEKDLLEYFKHVGFLDYSILKRYDFSSANVKMKCFMLFYSNFFF
jgi:tyrosyl-DNA phosphodiesterase-1